MASDAISSERFEPGLGSWRDWDSLVPETGEPDPIRQGLAEADMHLAAAAEGVGRGLARARLRPTDPEGDLAAERLRDLAALRERLEQAFPGNARVQDILSAAARSARDF